EVGDRADLSEAVLAAVGGVGVALEKAEQVALLYGACLTRALIEPVRVAEVEPRPEQPLNRRRSFAHQVNSFSRLCRSRSGDLRARSACPEPRAPGRPESSPTLRSPAVRARRSGPLSGAGCRRSLPRTAESRSPRPGAGRLPRAGRSRRPAHPRRCR